MPRLTRASIYIIFREEIRIERRDRARLPKKEISGRRERWKWVIDLKKEIVRYIFFFQNSKIGWNDEKEIIYRYQEQEQDPNL